MGQLYARQKNQFAWVKFVIKNGDDDLLGQFPSRRGGVSFQFISARGTSIWTQKEMSAYIERYFPESDYSDICYEADTSMNQVLKMLPTRTYPSYSRQPQLVDWEIFNELCPLEKEEAK